MFNNYTINIMTNNNDYNLTKEIKDKSITKIRSFNKKNDPVKLDYEMNVVDAIIFDQNDFHKNTKTLYSDRMVVRYHPVRKKF